MGFSAAKYSEIEKDAIWLINENNVETVASLINQNAKAKHHVKVGLDTDAYHNTKKRKN